MKTELYLAFLLTFMIIFHGCSGKEPAERGIRDGSLFPCPQTPNCVSSMTDDSSHIIAPIAYRHSREEALADIKVVIRELGNAEIREELSDYLWVECTSKLMRFVDDVEFFFPEEQNVVHVRSASRLGYSDMGVNRKRVEQIRRSFDRMQDNH